MDKAVSKNISLIIRDKNMDTNPLIKLLELENVKFYNKGEKISRVIPAFEEDVLIYTFEIEEDIDNAISDFVSKIKECMDYDKIIQKYEEVKIRLYIQTMEAQAQIVLSHKSMMLLESLKVKFEISLFSWGGVIDE